MAKQTLPTNFKDDILDTSVNTRRRYRMYENTDGTIELEDVTEYSQVGDVFGSGQINATNTEVNKKFDKNMLVRDLNTINAITKEGYAPDALALKEVNDSLGGLSFGYDETEQKYGYYKKEAGTDVFVPFSGNGNYYLTSIILNSDKTWTTVSIPSKPKAIFGAYSFYGYPKRYGFWENDGVDINDYFDFSSGNVGVEVELISNVTNTSFQARQTESANKISAIFICIY